MLRIGFAAVMSFGAVVLPVTSAHASTPIPNLAQLSAGRDHTCALTTTGGTKCWGLNDTGQLGDGSLTSRSQPPSTSIPGFATVAAGGGHTCAIATTGRGVWCWGNNAHAQVGNGGSGGSISTPIPITSNGGFNSDVDAISVGGEFSCGLKGGGVKCWGRNDSGQIGNNDPDTAFRPLQVSDLPPSSGTKLLASGGKHSCVITNTDTVKCWGLNDHGQLGNNNTTLSRVPVDVVGLTNVVGLALGGQHSCALTSAGAVKCWGANSSGAIGDNSTTDRLVPVAVSGLASGVSAIAAGGGETCAIAAGALSCWGQNSSGQVGDGTTTSRRVPVAVPGAGANIAAVTVGRAHACLRTTAGLSKCWGENENGQLGDGSTFDRYGPFFPDPPQHVVATRGDHSATITWQAPSSDGGFPIASYTITPSGGVAPQTVTMPAALSVTFDGLANGTAYTFAVKATNTVGASRSATSNAVTPAGLPGAPTNVKGTPGTATGTAVISWSAAPNNGSAIKTFTAVASPGGRSAKVSGTGSKVVVSGLSPGSTYSFSVTATNGVGQGPASSAVSVKLPKSVSGYTMLGANGAVYPFGESPRLGGLVYANWNSGTHAVAITMRPNGSGYWIVDNVGGVRAFGTAHYLGQHPRLNFGESVSTLAATPTGNGYWLFTNRGRAIPFGDARFLGDMSRVRLNGPVIASSATPTGKGYYMVASDGGVFTFGDARFKGSTGSLRLNKPVVGLSPTPTNGGYWLVAADGGVFAFGDAPYRGSMGGVRLSKPVNGLVPFGNGYLMVASDGGVFDFSNKPFSGSLGAHPPVAPIIGIAAFST
jgi:alpha-tubulin suppressor-like RCC1 family protein